MRPDAPSEVTCTRNSTSPVWSVSSGADAMEYGRGLSAPLGCKYAACPARNGNDWPSKSSRRMYARGVAATASRIGNVGITGYSVRL